MANVTAGTARMEVTFVTNRLAMPKPGSSSSRAAAARTDATLNKLLTRSNQTYNDAPKASSGRKPAFMVLFMAEADTFVYDARQLKSKAQQRSVLRLLASRARSGEVAVTPNAAASLNEYRRAIGGTVPVRSTRLEY